LASPALFRSLALLYRSLDRTFASVSPFQISLSRPGLINQDGCVLQAAAAGLENPETYCNVILPANANAKQNAFFRRLTPLARTQLRFN